MYAVRRIKYRSQNLVSVFRQSFHIYRSTLHRDKQINSKTVRNFSSVLLSLSNGTSPRSASRHRPCTLHNLSRFYSSESDGSNDVECKHVPTKDVHGHALLGEQEQKEWFNKERLSIDVKRKESPF